MYLNNKTSTNACIIIKVMTCGMPILWSSLSPLSPLSPAPHTNKRAHSHTQSLQSSSFQCVGIISLMTHYKPFNSFRLFFLFAFVHFFLLYTFFYIPMHLVFSLSFAHLIFFSLGLPTCPLFLCIGPLSYSPF